MLKNYMPKKSRQKNFQKLKLGDKQILKDNQKEIKEVLYHQQYLYIFKIIYI